MEKIKINMMSGQSIEKPLVTAFKGNAGEYIVFDNEANGTMGLPIILVSKLVGGKLSLIADTEWNAVKENLRMIIAGNQVDYITVDANLMADDMFFKQLTLPVASFEALKNNYKPIGATTSPVGGPTTLGTMPNPTIEPMPSVTPSPDLNQAQVINPTPVAPVNPAPSPMETPINNPINEMNTIAQTPVTPVMPEPPVQSQTVAPVQPAAPVMPNPVPNVEPVPEPVENTPVDLTVDKEAFLKACENMFDALVAKLKK